MTRENVRMKSKARTVRMGDKYSSSLLDLSLTADWSSSDEKDTKTKKLALDPNT